MAEKRINILHLRDSPYVDGPGRTILESANRIDSYKYRYFIGAFCKRNMPATPFYNAAVNRGLDAFRINESNSMDATALMQIMQIIEREKIDIIHSHEVRSDIIALIAGKMTGVAVATTLHGWIGNDFKARVLTFIDKHILRFFDHVIPVSEKMKNKILRYRVRKENITVLYNALVLDQYQRNLSDRTLRRGLKIGENALLVGNIGRLSPEKGQNDFILAARNVVGRYKDVFFLLVGEGNERPKLESLVQNIGISDKVLFLGYRNDMISIYNNLDLVVQSSFTEGMPNVVLEALAMETPVIATDVGGTSEAVINNVTGVLIQPGKPDELAEQIIKFIKSRDRFEKMSIKGKKAVEAKFGFDERTKKLSLIYDRLVSNRRMVS